MPYDDTGILTYDTIDSPRGPMVDVGHSVRHEGLWYVVHIAPAPLDILVLKWLKWIGIESYQFTKIDNRPRRKPERVALFPGYIFVNFDVHASMWRTIHQIPGVIRLISTGPEYPIPLPDGLFDELIAHHRDPEPIIFQEAQRTVFEVLKKAILKKGDEIRILRGPLANFRAVCEREYDEKVEAEVTVFGRSSSVTFNRSDVIESATETPA